MTDKKTLLLQGTQLMAQFCELNSLVVPEVRVSQSWPFDVCGYYRPTYIAICTPKCAAPGFAHRAWSWPGYIIDRTPYGVVQHELGHHADYWAGTRRQSYSSDFSTETRKASGEDKLTNYCPNDAEWFAEMFRLFVTNPDLLRCVRPRTFDLLFKKLKPLDQGSWLNVLENAPQRTIDMAARRIKETKHAKGTVKGISVRLPGL